MNHLVERNTRRRRRLAAVLTVFGCGYWLLLLAAAVDLFTRYGFHQEGFGFAYDSIPLLGIPIAMAILTVIVGSHTGRGRSRPVILASASMAAIVATVWWVAIWGQGV